MAFFSAAAPHPPPAPLPPPLLPAAPDLSMEVTAWMQDIVAEAEAACMAEVPVVSAPIRLPEAQKGAAAAVTAPASALEVEKAHERLQNILARHTVSVVHDMVALLQRFYPDLTKEQVTEHVHNAVHSEEVFGCADQWLRCTARTLVPRDRREWLAEDIMAHIAAVRKSPGLLRKLTSRLSDAVHDPMLRVVFISASGGAATLGAAGFSVGMATGATAGAIVGIVPAFFTFFLSVPFCAAIGGGIGAFCGVATGGSLGLVGGGFLGAGGYKYGTGLKARAASAVRSAQTSVRSGLKVRAFGRATNAAFGRAMKQK